MDMEKELLERVYAEEDKILLQEAIKCLKAKALRAAYIMTWIAVAESLKRKIKEISFRNHEVRRIVGQIKRKEENNQPIDKFLLDKALEIEIIPKEFHDRIEHLYKMRCIFAHPYENSPTEIEVLCALQVAVDGVLSRPPLLRHGYIAQLLDNIFGNYHYLDDTQEKVFKFAKEVIQKIDPKLYPYLLINLCKRLERIMDDPDQIIFIRRAVWFGQGFLLLIKPDLKEEKWRCEQILIDHPKASSCIFTVPELWKLLSERYQDMVLSIKLFPQNGQPSRKDLNIFWDLKAKGLLTKRQEKLFYKCVERMPAGVLVETNIDTSIYIGRIISDLQSYDFYKQNPAIQNLRKLGTSKIKELSDHIQEDLGRNVIQSAHGGAYLARDFVADLSKGGEKWPLFFIKGLLYECFLNEQNELRFKGDIKSAILAAIRSSYQPTQGLFNELSKLIETAKFKYEIYQEEIRDIVNIISETVTFLTEEEKEHYEEYLTKLVKALNCKKQECKFKDI